jgi:hypothetical protein
MSGTDPGVDPTDPPLKSVLKGAVSVAVALCHRAGTTSGATARGAITRDAYGKVRRTNELTARANICCILKAKSKEIKVFHNQKWCERRIKESCLRSYFFVCFVWSSDLL